MHSASSDVVVSAGVVNGFAPVGVARE